MANEISKKSILLAKSYYYAKINDTSKWLEVSEQLVTKHKDLKTARILGVYYLRQRECDKSIKYYKLLLEDDHLRGAGLDGLCANYIWQKDYVKFLNTLDELKKVDKSFYYYNYASYLCHVKRDIKGAEKVVNEAIKNKSSKARELAIAFANFLDDVKDYKRAFKFYSMFEDTGDKRAILRIGQYYLYGFGVKQDINKALEYLLQIDIKGVHYTIGKFFLDEKYTPKDYDLALHHLVRAAQQGHELALFALSILYGDDKFKYYSSQKSDEFLRRFFRVTKGDEKVYEEVTTYIEKAKGKRRDVLEEYVNKYWNRKDIQA